jgi:hypothetical protein
VDECCAKTLDRVIDEGSDLSRGLNFVKQDERLLQMAKCLFSATSPGP